MKNKNLKRMLALLLMLSMLTGMFPVLAVAAATDAVVYDITVNDLTAPIGIDDPNPSFGWKMASDAVGAAQSAYNIVVTDQNGKTTWDTGWVESNDSFAIEYAGEALESSMVYTVAVKIKDQNGVATEVAATTFETGLYEEDAFADTQWIRFNDAGGITSYTIEFDTVIERYCMGFSFGMTDKSNLVMWQLNLSNSTNARFLPHVRTNGTWAKTTYDLGSGKTYDMGLGGSDLLNKNLHMTIKVTETLAETWLSIEGAEAVKLPDHTLSKVIPIANWGIRAYGAHTNGTSLSNLELSSYDNIVIKDADGTVLYSEDFSGEDPVQALTSGVDAHAIRDGRLYIDRVNSNAEHLYMFDTGLRHDKNILNSKSAPVFRKEVEVGENLVSAKLYSSALGVYENFINGTRVGHLQEDGSYIYDELKPGYTLYAKSIFYSTFDVTHLLTEGENVLSSVVTTGWWNPAAPNGSQHGINNAYFAKLILTYADGTKQVIDTDTTWMTAKAGPVLYSTGIFPGERYDATQDTSWMLPGYDDHQWKPALINNELDLSESLRAWDAPQARIWPEKERTPKSIYTYTNVENVVYDTDGTTVLQYGKVIKDVEYKDGDDIPLKKGQTLVVDFVQNGSGWEELTFTAPKGTKLTIKRGEIINDGNGAKSRNMTGPEGSVRAQGIATNTYTTGTDETVTWHPYLTYGGFSCLSITATKDVVIHKVRGQVLSSIQGDSAFMETSDPDVNQYLSNVKWSMYSNFMHIPADCCQREERLGWTGDAQSFSNAVLLQGVGGKSFMEKYVLDIVQSQRMDPENEELYGAYDQIAPSIRIYRENGQGATGWADAGIIIPYNLYKMYGDTEIIETVWDSMCIFMDEYLADREYGGSTEYDDWMCFDATNDNTKNMNSLSYVCWDARMMAEMANAIGKSADVQKYQAVYEQRRQQYIDEFVAEDGTLKYFTQCGALYALYVDLLPSEESVAAVTKQLIDNIEACGNKLQTGFLGTTIIMPTLSKIGRTDIAYKLLLQHENPSWLFAVDNGATTVWERWNTYSYELGYPTTKMSSMNHYWTGTITAWMYQTMLGLGSSENGAGYQNMTIAPHPDRSLPMVKGTYDSAYGPVSAKMEYADTAWTYDLTIPANTTATVKLPLEADDCTVTVNGKAPEDVTLAADGIAYVETVDNTMIFNAVAGAFSFVSDRELVEMKKDEANAALNNLKIYQHTAAVTEENLDKVTGLINTAKTAIAEFEAAGGDVANLTGYGWLAGAEAACVANAKYMIDQYTLQFDFKVVEGVSQIAFGIKDTNNLFMWQLSMQEQLYSGKSRLRLHVKNNGSYKVPVSTAITDIIGPASGAIGKPLQMRIEVNGTEVNTYLGEPGTELTYVSTYHHTEPVTLYNVGFRCHSSSENYLEICQYDNILVKDAEGNVLLNEDFSDPTKVTFGGTSNATDYSFEDGWVQIGDGSITSEQIYILGEPIAYIDEAENNKAAAAAVDALIEAINVEDKATIEAARAAYEALTEEQKALVTKLTELEAAELHWNTVNNAVSLVLSGADTVNPVDGEAAYTLSAKGMHNLATVSMEIAISAEYLSAPEAKAADGWMIVAQVWKDGVLHVVAANNDGANGDGKILTITAKVLEKAGTATVTVTAAEMGAYLGEGETFVKADLTAASVSTVVEYNRFDVNKDGTVNLLDIARAQRWYDTDNKDADVNEDGEVNIDDLILILNNYSDLFD